MWQGCPWFKAHRWLVDKCLLVLGRQQKSWECHGFAGASPVSILPRGAPSKEEISPRGCQKMPWPSLVKQVWVWKGLALLRMAMHSASSAGNQPSLMRAGPCSLGPSRCYLGCLLLCLPSNQADFFHFHAESRAVPLRAALSHSILPMEKVTLKINLFRKEAKAASKNPKLKRKRKKKTTTTTPV